MIPLLEIYPRELKSESQRDVSTPMFIAAPFTIAKIRKQLLCPSKYEFLKTVYAMVKNLYHFL